MADSTAHQAMKAFNRVAGKAAGEVSRLSLCEAILAERPDLKGEMVYFPPSQGSCAHTIIIGDEVFKGQKHEGTEREFDREIRTLSALQGKSLPIPVLTCVGEKAYFYGMKKIPGQTLSACADRLDAAQEEALGAEIGAVIAALSTALTAAELDETSWPGRYNGYLDPRKFLVVLDHAPTAAALRGHGLSWLAAEMHDYFEGLKDRPKTLIHGDLWQGNVMCDPETGRLTGVIDFGYADRTWPEVQAQLFSKFFSEDTVRGIMKTWGMGQRREQVLSLVAPLLLGVYDQAVLTAEQGGAFYRGELDKSLRKLEEAVAPLRPAAPPPVPRKPWWKKLPML